MRHPNAIILLVAALMLSIGPRVNPFGLPGDIRFQDFLVPFAFGWSLLVDTPKLLRGQLLGRTQTLMAYAQLLILAWFLFQVSNELTGFTTFDNLAVSAGFSLRYAELPLFAVLGARLAVHCPKSTGVALVLGFFLGNLANLFWIGVQVATNSRTTLWSFSDTVPAMYGPGLIGEGGVFGVGHYLTICVSVITAVLLVGKTRILWFPLLSLIALNLGALTLVNSRASLLSTAVILTIAIVAAMMSVSPRPRNVFAGAAATAALVVGLYVAVPRLRPDKVYGALRERILDRYLPTIDGASTSPLVGLGPGKAREAARGETHNLYMLLLGDFGLLGLTLVLTAFALLLYLALQTLKMPGSEIGRIFAYLAIFIVVFWVVAGLAQDSILPANSNHLAAIAIGVFFAVRNSGVHESSVGSARSSTE